MTKKNKTIIIIAAVIVVAVAVFLIVKNRKFRKYNLTSSAHDFLQIYSVDKGGNVDYKSYATGGDKVKVAPSKQISVMSGLDGVDQMLSLIPIKKIWWGNGDKRTYNSQTDYITADSIVLE